MKIGAGIAGILLGLFALGYVGIFGGMIGTAAGWLGSIGPGNSSLSTWASMVSLISWLAPILCIAGGVVTFSNPRAGGALMAVSAGLLWYILGLGTIGKTFVLPIGAAAVLAWLAAESNSNADPFSKRTGAATGPAEVAHATSHPADSGSAPAPQGFDRAKWEALLKYDSELSSVAERIRPLGAKWLAELAASYMALNDKSYLPSIEHKIVAAAKEEREESARRSARAEEEQKASAEERERRAEEERRAWQLRVPEREKQQQLWREKVWGTPRAKLKSLAIAAALLAITALILLAARYWITELRERDYKALLTDLGDMQITLTSNGANAYGDGMNQWHGLVTRDLTTTILSGPADGTRAFPISGALRATFSRSQLGDCESQLSLGVSRLTNVKFKCSDRPFLHWEISKRPHTRRGSVTVSFAGAAGNDQSVAPAGARYEVYALDLQATTARRLVQGSYASVIAISTLGDRAVAVLDDGVHVLDLASGRDFAPKASHGSSACAGLEVSFTNDEGTRFQVRQRSPQEMQVTPLDGGPVYRPANDRIRRCPANGRYDVTADGMIVYRGQ